MIDITSTTNPKIKRTISLYDRRDRDREGLFVIEGFREVSRAVQSGVVCQEVFFCESLFLGSNEHGLLQRLRQWGARPYHVAESVFRKMSYRDRPDGIIAVAQKMAHTLDDTALPDKPIIVIAEAIEKPGNLGTIIRSSDAAGVAAVIVANGCTDIYNPNVVRSSVGTLFTIPVIEATNEEALAFCQAQHIELLATVPDGEQVYSHVPMRGAVGIVVGTEQLGLSSFWKKECHKSVRIPMHGQADSLNVATATTIFLFEAVRQRDVYHHPL